MHHGHISTDFLFNKFPKPTLQACLYAPFPVMCQYDVRYSAVQYGTIRYGMGRLDHIYGKIRYNNGTVPKAENCLLFAVKGNFGSFFQNTNVVTYISPI
jgi:hypothetical protein